MDRTYFDFAAARTHSRVWLFAVAAVVAGIALAAPAQASLIVESIRYDAHVKTGSTIGIEQHFTNDDAPSNIPAINTLLPAPLQAGRDLHSNVTETNDLLNTNPPKSFRHFILQIQALNPALDTFVNPYDPGVANAVELEAFMHSDNLPAGQQIMIFDVGIEDGNDVPPYASFPEPPVSVITGIGSVANPLHLQLAFPGSLVSTLPRGFIKLHLSYMTMAVPEPTTAGMLLVGVFGAASGIRRKRA